MTSRRGFLIGLAGALAAPAVVRAESLMKLWVPPDPRLLTGVDLAVAWADISVGDFVTFSAQSGKWVRAYGQDGNWARPMGVASPGKTPVILPFGSFTLPSDAADSMALLMKAATR